jgi:hypothetical protein
MPKLQNLVLILFLSLVVGACAGRRDAVGPGDFAASGDFIGMLQYSPPGECPYPSGCGPEFSLLDETLSTWTPLQGDVDPAHNQLVIQVDGRTTGIDRDDREFLGSAAAENALKVRRYRLLSEIPYHDFLVAQASEFTTRKYGCELLWDKTFSWRLAEDRVHLIVRMTNTFHRSDTKPFLELSFDGTTGHFLKEDLEPWGINPCQEG